MAIIKKFSPLQRLSGFQVFVNDLQPNSQYFKISEFEETFTGGKNGFLIEGSEFLKESTEVKIEILDVDGTPIYYEPGDGIPEYYEGTSKLVSVHIYDDTSIGTGKITILGELKNYVDENGAVVPVPDEWKGIYNVKWERTFQINKNISNETRVRFYKRPTVSITELVKPIFSKTIPTVTDTGTATGEPVLPSFGTDLTNYRAGTSFKLTRSSGSWDRDVDENSISFSSLGYTPNIIEVLNDKQVLVDVPYSTNNIVGSFVSQSYSVTYSDFQNEIIGESTLTGSFAKIDITQLKTFVGDVARVKVFRKSRNAVGDFQFVQESKLESTELLRDVTTTSNTEIPYGRFDETNLQTYWITSSVDHPVTIDSSVLSQAVKFDYDSVQGGVQRLITSQSFEISKDVEYTLNFRTLLSGSIEGSKSIKAFFSSSNFTQDFVTVSGSAIYTTRQSVSQNILSENSGSAYLVFEATGDDWYLSNVSLKNAQDTSFSPDEFTLIQDIPRKLASETFDFRFEFYDINNNYIPVDVTAVGVFDGGNDFPTSGKLLTFESDRNAFRFSSGSVQNPENQVIKFAVTQNNLTGSLTFASSAFDTQGNYLNPSDYTQYPGFLTSVTPAGALITINNFTGSRTDGNSEPFVGSIVYTASLDSLQEFETVYRLEDGENAPQLIVTSNANQFIYEPTSLSPKPSGQSITIRAQRKNLASLITPLTVNSGSNAPLTYVSTVNGIDTYTISATEFSSSFASSNFEEVTYQFTGSDVFGNEQYDEITLSKVINFDGVSVVLSTENTSFQSDSTGTVTSTEFNKGDGTVDVRIGSNEISHSEGLGTKNTFDIISVTPSTGLTANSTSPTTNSYGISAMSVDSGTLTLLIRYKAGDDSTAVDFTKVVNYSKNKKAAPVISIETTNKDQSVSALSTGEQVDSFSNSIVTVKETYDGSTTTKTITSLTATSSDISSISTTPSTGTITLSGKTLADGTNTTKVAVSATVTDSEGTSRSVTDTISLSKVKKAQPSITFSATPQSQTIDAKSTGVLIGSITDVQILGFEGNTALTYNQGTLSDSQYKITGVTQNNITVSDTTPNTATNGVIDITALSADSTTETATIAYQDSEGTSGTQTIKFSLSKSKKAVPNVVISATPQSQNVSANSSGTQTGTLSNVTVTALEGTTSRFTSMTVSAVSGINVTTGTTYVSGNTLTLSGRTLSAAEASITLTVTHTDSEGSTGQTQSITVRVTKSSDGGNGTPGTNGVTINVSPTSQIVKRSTGGTYATPAIFTVTVAEDGALLTHQTGTGTPATSKFTITSLSNGTLSAGSGTTTPDITPTTPTTTAGLTTTFNIKYTDSQGNTSSVIAQSHVVSVVLDGVTGPGVVHTGVWESGRAYQFDDGLLTGTGRRDTVLWSSNGSTPYDTYYATNASHTSVSTNSTNGAPHQSNSTRWVELGTQDFFVAAKIGLFEESYVQNTLNIGTNANGGVSSANITLYGGSDYPYFSLGQTPAGVYGANGIFIGNDSGNYRASFVNTNGHLKWNGSTLDIKGSITFTNASSIDISGFNNDSGFTDDTAANAAQNAADDAQDAADAAQSDATTALTRPKVFRQTSAPSTSEPNGSLWYDTDDDNKLYILIGTTWTETRDGGIADALADAASAQTLAGGVSTNLQNLIDGTAILGGGTFINGSIVYSPVIGGANGYISNIFKVGNGGITLDGPNKKIFTGTGTYGNSNTPFYVDNSSNFSLGNKVTWDGSTFTVSGAITGSTISGGTVTGASLVGGSINVPNSTNPLFSVDAGGAMSASDASISGEITATSGLLGSWVVDPPGAGGSLKDSDARIILNPTDKRISLFNSSGDLKAQIRADDSLSSIGSGNIYVSSIGTSISAPGSVTSNSGNTQIVTGTPSYGSVQTFTVPSAGEYQLSDLFNYSTIPSINLSSLVSGLGTLSIGTGSPAGNLSPTSNPYYDGIGSVYSSEIYRKYLYQYLYFVVEDSGGTEIAEFQLGYSYASGGYSINNYYTSTGTGIYDWSYTSGYSGTGTSNSYPASGPITGVVNFSSSGTYRVRYKTVMKAASGQTRYLNGSSYSFSNTTYTTSGGGVAVSSLDSNVQFNKPSNFIEMSGGGFQAVTTSDQFVKVFRYDTGGTYSNTLLQVRGGQTSLQNDADNDTTLYVVKGKSNLSGQTLIGGNHWYNQNFYDPFGTTPALAYLSGLNLEPYTLGPSSSSNPANLAYAISQGGVYFKLYYSSTTNRYYELPNQLANSTYNPSTLTNIPEGTILVLFNRDDGNSVYVRGFLHGSSSSSDPYLELVGGRAHICIWMGSSYGSNPTQYYKWVLLSTYDNTW